MAIGFTNITSGGGGVRGLSAQPSDVRMGMTFSRDGKTAETGALNLTNLRPENIRHGVNIAGVTGYFRSYNNLMASSSSGDGAISLKFNEKFDSTSPARGVALNFAGSGELFMSRRRNTSSEFRIGVNKNGQYYTTIVIKQNEQYGKVNIDFDIGDKFTFHYSYYELEIAPPQLKFYIRGIYGSGLYETSN